MNVIQTRVYNSDVNPFNPLHLKKKIQLFSYFWVCKRILSVLQSVKHCLDFSKKGHWYLRVSTDFLLSSEYNLIKRFSDKLCP